jgi:hypothetical protein
MIRVYLSDKRNGSMICADFVADPAEPGTGHWEFDEKEYGEVRWYPLCSTGDLIRQAEAALQKQRAVVVIDPGNAPNPTTESIPYPAVAA